MMHKIAIGVMAAAIAVAGSFGASASSPATSGSGYSMSKERLGGRHHAGRHIGSRAYGYYEGREGRELEGRRLGREGREIEGRRFGHEGREIEGRRFGREGREEGRRFREAREIREGRDFEGRRLEGRRWEGRGEDNMRRAERRAYERGLWEGEHRLGRVGRLEQRHHNRGEYGYRSERPTRSGRSESYGRR